MSGLLEQLMGETGGPSLFERVGQADSPLAAFDAARISRTDAGFLPVGLGPNAEAEQFGGLPRIVARSRYLHDNNELVDNATERDIDRVIGTGIDDIQPSTGFDDLDEQIEALYEFAFNAVDLEREFSLAEMQALYWRERRQAGECMVRIVMGEAWKGYPRMPAIELIEAERIPFELNGINPANGNAIRQGVEYDDQWRKVAYHVLVAHPRDGDPALGGLASSISSIGWQGIGSPGLKRIPIEDMGGGGIARKLRRLRQLRGVPELVSAMRTIRTEDQYVDTQMTHARTAAGVGVIFETPDAAIFKTVNGKTPLLVDAAGNPVTTLSPGGVAFKKPGTSAPLTMHANLPGPQFEPTVRGLQRRISRGLGGSYSEISGDYSQETFASNRANRIDQRQRDIRNQEMGIYRPLVRPFCRTLIQWAVLVGRVKLTPEHLEAIKANPEVLYRANVPAPGNAYVNPQQEASAVQTDLASGVRSEIDVINSAGGDWKRTIRQRVKFHKKLAEELEAAGLDRSALAPAAASGQSGGQGGGGGGGGGQGGQEDQNDDAGGSPDGSEDE